MSLFFFVTRENFCRTQIRKLMNWLKQRWFLKVWFETHAVILNTGLGKETLRAPAIKFQTFMWRKFLYLCKWKQVSNFVFMFPYHTVEERFALLRDESAKVWRNLGTLFYNGVRRWYSFWYHKRASHITRNVLFFHAQDKGPSSSNSILIFIILDLLLFTLSITDCFALFNYKN